MDLLTDEARIVWLRWKERMSDDDSWGPGLAAPPDATQSKLYDGTPIRAELLALADEYIAHPPTGTINCIAVNEKGDISGTTTTSGLFHKLAGRVGDSPLIGCGLFVDNETNLGVLWILKRIEDTGLHGRFDGEEACVRAGVVLVAHALVFPVPDLPQRGSRGWPGCRASSIELPRTTPLA